MKKIVLLVALVSIFSVLSCAKKEKVANSDVPVQIEKDSSLPDLKGVTIEAVTENAFVPLNFIDPETGEGIGLEYDLVNTIGYLLNANISWNITNWDTLISSVREKQFDVGMDGITINDERKKILDFSDPYIKAEQVLVVRSDEDRFSSIDEFRADESLLIGSQAGTTLFYTAVYDILDGNEQNPRIQLFDNFALITQALITKEVDLIIMDKVSAVGYIGNHKNKVKIIGDPIKSEDFGFIFPKGSEYRDPFNKALAYIKSQGTLEELEQKWYNQ